MRLQTFAAPDNWTIIGDAEVHKDNLARYYIDGARVAIVTSALETICQMSCNPAIGGVAKGHIVKEIDALGGEMASVIDATGIQFRRLNASKGPAVRSTRAQADKRRYRDAMRGRLEAQANLEQGKANRELARITAERTKMLTARGIAPLQEGDQSQAQLSAQDANVRALEKAILAQRSNLVAGRLEPKRPIASKQANRGGLVGKQRRIRFRRLCGNAGLLRLQRLQ